MTVAGLISHMRRREADLASSTVKITDPAASGTLNTTTGIYTPDAASVLYDGPGLVRPLVAREADAAERLEHLGRHLVKIPADTTIPIGAQVEVTDDTHDDDLIGAVMTVVDVEVDAWQVVRRLTCERQRG